MALACRNETTTLFHYTPVSGLVPLHLHSDGQVRKHRMWMPSISFIDSIPTQRVCSSGFNLALGQHWARSLSPKKTLATRPYANSWARKISNLNHTPVHVGTTYEHLCLHGLCRLGFSLSRTGGKSDKGIDLLGVWKPPVPASASPTLRVIVQCKAYAGQVQPALIRELEGSIVGAPEEWRNDDTFGVLCTPKGATAGIRDAMRMAERGIIWATIEERLGSEKISGHAKVTQLLWNERVRKAVAEGLGAGLKFIPGDRGMAQEVVLMLNGRVWQAK